MKSQSGYTLPELLFALWFLVCLCLAGGVVYAAIHFVTKFW